MPGFHAHAVARIGIERTIDDVRPVRPDHRGGRSEANFSRAMVEMNLVHDLYSGSKKLPAGTIGLEVRLVGGREKRALVMIEPPGEARILSVLEVQMAFSFPSKSPSLNTSPA